MQEKKQEAVIRPATARQDQKILKMYFEGIRPKSIVRRLSLLSVHVVYEALRRSRMTNVYRSLTTTKSEDS